MPVPNCRRSCCRAAMFRARQHRGDGYLHICCSQPSANIFSLASGSSGCAMITDSSTSTPPARPGGKLIVTVLYPRRSESEIASPGHVVVFKRLQDLEVGNISAEMHCNHSAQGPATVVRGDTYIVGFCQSRNLLGLHESATVDDVRLDDVRAQKKGASSISPSHPRDLACRPNSTVERVL
jgi:hypothetical protein